ncbi:DNA polymerase elongation subunit (family B) [Paenibacillus eucommiae]|uniref:DNA polymerase elongation subunit (Family B) n=1 Tax=Paenibacillus eucommiae TaxID=1355755 RepID=A0ABS4J0E9_9BACL|nr:DNA polymerase elongation subunit (family B) [Paenibacillus eucommiae]
MKDGTPIKQEFLKDVMKQILSCKHCTEIVSESSKTPIRCTKYAGSLVPISVNLATCITCGDYKLK